MATFTLEEIGQRVSDLPPLADPAFDAALAFINDLGGIENLKPEHVLNDDEKDDDDDLGIAPLSDAITRLVEYQEACWSWSGRIFAFVPVFNPSAPAEYGL